MCPHHHIVVGINEVAASFSTSFLCCSGLLINAFAPSGMMFSSKFSYFPKKKLNIAKLVSYAWNSAIVTISFMK